MQRSADNGGLVMMHAENGIAIDVLVEQALAEGKTDPRYHGEVRRVLLEAEATHRTIQLARVAGAPLYVVHVSAEEALAEIAQARDSKIPNGKPGVENRMDLLHQGVVEGRISRRRWIEIACATPARMFGLYPKKGTIAPGADADLVLYDPTAEQTVSAETHHMNVDYSPYEGKRLTGRVETVPSRGELVIDRREFTGHAGHGQYIPRGTCQYLI